MIKAVIFDFDLTIANTFFAVKKGVEILSEHFGKPMPSDSEIYAMIGLPLNDCWKKLWGYFDPAWLEYFSEVYRPHQADLFELFPDTEETLSALKASGIALGIVTNRHFIKSCLEKLKITDYFSVAIGAEEMRHPKPHPESLFTAMKLLGVDKNETLYVGDTDIDMKTATAAGVTPVGVAQGHFDRDMLKAVGAKYALPSISGLKKLIAELQDGDRK